ncbi:hydroxymethylglutaryl-CoA lyase [Peredibacter sp. HCB2-198]|uniref:hydroxymethylglutaryl-CoA lyase n=1 Tax=Peredibacter sp. HCB2-198 TaxID=3383025 RepID=UPI0038B4D698
MIKIVEVGPRDGLQNEKSILSTEDKFKFISLLCDAGLRTIEVTSFVKAPAIPQMADAVELYTKVKNELGDRGVAFPCLVPNMKGYETAKNLGVKEIALFTATSDSFTKKNINATVDESFERMKEVADAAKRDGILVRGYVSTAFGCPYEGTMDVKKLISVTKRLFELGVYEVSVGDTIGVATPMQVRSYIRALKSEFPIGKIAMHLHDTRGMAPTNIFVSLEEGITTFDSSAGGLGGCPYAKGATGNVATEDVWYLLNSQGLETGIDIKKLSEASQFILSRANRQTESKFLRAYLNTGKV